MCVLTLNIWDDNIQQLYMHVYIHVFLVFSVSLSTHMFLQEDLDALTASGSAINDLEMQLTRVKVQYKRTVIESREKMDAMRRKLGNSIKKSEPFVDIWRKARQVSDSQNES